MIFVFNLVIIAIASILIQFTAQVPHQGSDVQHGLYGRHYDKPWYSSQELQDLDGSVPEKLSNSNIMRSRKKGKNRSGFRQTKLSHAMNNQREMIIDRTGVPHYYYLLDKKYKLGKEIYDMYEDIDAKHFYVKDGRVHPIK